MALRYIISNLPPGLGYDSDTGIISGEPAAGLATANAPEKVYEVSVLAVDDNGLYVERTFNWTIKYTVEVVFVAGAQTSFAPVVTLDAGASFTPEWDFGDGNTAVTATPAHTYASTGSYVGSVRLAGAETLGLSFASTGISELDITSITTLETIDISNNQVEELDVTDMTDLVSLKCTGNLLNVLDVGNLTALTELECGSNMLDSLDVGNLTALTTLYCENNAIDSLDTSGMASLTDLDASSNYLSSIDLAAATGMVNINLASNSLSSLDVSGMASLESLDCRGNSITGITFNAGATALDAIYVQNNNVSQASLDGMSAHLVSIGGTSVRTLDVSGQDPQAFLDEDDYAALLSANWIITADLVPDFTLQEGATAGVDFDLDFSEYLIGATAFTALGMPSGLTVNSSTGVVEGYIDGDTAGVYEVTIYGTNGTPDSEVFQITVTPINLLETRGGDLIIQRDGTFISER